LVFARTELENISCSLRNGYNYERLPLGAVGGPR